MSDTSYQEKSGIFEIQRLFQENDKIKDSVIAFLNIFDKGYRNRLAAWRHGRQLTLQPTFAKSDQKFRRRETLSSASVASERAANERAVRLVKFPGYLSQGLQQRQKFHRLQYVWLTSGFRANFMFLPA